MNIYSIFGKKQQQQQQSSSYYHDESLPTPVAEDNNNDGDDDNDNDMMTIMTQPELLQSSSSSAASILFGTTSNQTAQQQDLRQQTQSRRTNQQQEEEVIAVRPETIDTLLAQELNQMTFQEREHIHEEIHGVHTLAVDETKPEFVSHKLRLLERAISDLVPPSQKVAYDEAVRLNSSYVKDETNFRLPFLRAELFDTAKAAFRLTRFLDFMYDLYGPDALMRPMTLADLSPIDMKLMKEGCFQVLPGRDRSGRRMLGIFDDIPPEYSFRTRVGTILVDPDG
jgi:hypothetical protein